MFTLYITLTISLLFGALLLHLLPKFSKIGQEWSDKLCYAPGIDLTLSYFMLLPLLIGFWVQKSSGLAIGLVSEISALWIWIIIHEWIHREQWQDSKIHRTNSKIFGGWRNHLAVWITALAIPVFWIVRFAELIVYPPLTQLIKLPKYEAKDWVNVSRHKFVGLIGYDLIWCLYCDWMTGVWSLGTEMLRNVESFWCPIRFYSDKKCANCKIDFPDIEKGWVSCDSTMQDVEKLLKEKYSNQKESSWFNHPSRLENLKND
ncbi:hypothetical protein C7H19_05040 [Aphanothece hegewaldii CCALA 016]|uniref:Uncharacterized protein n=1 Tax=Aphanothece hegewaldii CCALA 016 TaxID=2107694 RepID=A0A2T1M0Z4_9CHRO|nr:hypothetical protein [Aphanothece hegewaldii]PSF38360.1 hypothetical protein C7H19_05040 [Aphanothece hegewaldii CCALA 016]